MVITVSSLIQWEQILFMMMRLLNCGRKFG